jgi:AcrR family transcriptional regulator
MGRRSDHTRSELTELFVAEGRRQLARTGLAGFSARDVAKRVGYSIGTLYNVFGSYDGLVVARTVGDLGRGPHRDPRARLLCVRRR